MTIFLIGLGLFVLGSVLNVVGWRMHSSEVKGVPDALWEWLIEVFRQQFPLLTGPDSTIGQRVAAFGALLAAIGLAAVVVGLVAIAA